MMTEGKDALFQFLQGKDLRSTERVEELVPLIREQAQFDELFRYLNSSDRIVVMRAADAIEKISRENPEFLQPHKEEILDFLETAKDKEFKWHLVQIVPRLELSQDELGRAWDRLTCYAKEKKESRIVRVNSLQALSDLTSLNKDLKEDLKLTFEAVEPENIPSINARIKKLRKRK